MKPVYLEFCGVNSFSEKAQIDFGKLLEGGLFGIFGDTGSGKSTILDCIHFALYGKIERSSGSVTDSINEKCDRAYVVYDFEILHDGARHTYRVRRERRRKNSVPKASLYEADGEGKWQALAEGTIEVDRRVEEIIGLGFDDFKKCIALPQGEFAGLVRAKPSERLQLVSRLFDLEKYGEKLSAAVRGRCVAADNQLDVLRSRLQENAEGTEERVREEKEKLSAAVRERESVGEALSAAEKEYNSLARLAEEKREYDSLSLRVRRAEEKLPFYADRKRKLALLPGASRVSDCVREKEKNERGRAKAEEAAARTELSLSAFRESVELKRKRLEESGLDGKIRALSVTQGRLEAAEKDMEAFREAQKKLDDCTEKYRQLKNRVLAEDFDGLLAANDEAKAALGEDESFTEYLRRNFKDVLLSEAYAQFRADLKMLGDKYPAAAEDIGKLAEKYTLAEAGSARSFDVAAAKLEFDRAEKRRKALAAERNEIEARKKKFEDNEREKKNVVADGKHYRERLELARKAIETVKDLGTPEEVKKQIDAASRAKKCAEEEIAQEEEKLTELAKKLAESRTEEKLCAEGARAAAETLSALLSENGFADETAARAVVAELGDGRRAREECDAFYEEYNAAKSRLAAFPAEKFGGFSEEKISAAEARKKDLSAQNEALLQRIAVGERETERLSGLRERYKALEKEIKEKEREKELLEKLRILTMRGKFMEFIASEYLQEVCVSASRTLLSLTGGRYFLRYEDEFRAGDNLNGGALRSVRTLSGGETFLVSLSLALALSGAICAKSLRPIEFFFLDEGFGTLDEKLVDTVMDVLEKLRSRNFSVGVISHVEELKNRIDNKILVTGATEGQGSRVRVEAY